ncbi:MAG: phosphatase PAP2 family protein [Ginsengibacter sp.]
MKFVIKALLLLALNVPAIGFAQDSLSNRNGLYQNNVSDTPLVKKVLPEEIPLMHFNTYFSLLGTDLRMAFTQPFHQTNRDWRTFGKFVLAAGVVSLADEPVQKEALRMKNGSTGLDKISKGVTDFGGTYGVLTLVGVGSFGWITGNHKLVNTTLLSTQSYITGAAVETVLKYLTGRRRPSSYKPGEEAEPKFAGYFPKGFKNNGNTSFPSGHSTVAFAVATVFATEYKDKPLVPVIAYTTASLIGLSRIAQDKHWLSDVFVGAALGYVSGKLTVNNYHRYKDVRTGKKKNSVSFSLHYNYDHVEPAMVYKFK